MESYRAWNILNCDYEGNMLKDIELAVELNWFGHDWKKNIKTTININSKPTEVKWFLIRLCWESWQSRKISLQICDCEISFPYGVCKRQNIQELQSTHKLAALEFYCKCTFCFCFISNLVLKLLCVKINVTFPGFLSTYFHLSLPHKMS